MSRSDSLSSIRSQNKKFRYPLMVLALAWWLGGRCVVIALASKMESVVVEKDFRKRKKVFFGGVGATADYGGNGADCPFSGDGLRWRGEWVWLVPYNRGCLISLHNWFLHTSRFVSVQSWLIFLFNLLNTLFCWLCWIKANTLCWCLYKTVKVAYAPSSPKSRKGPKKIVDDLSYEGFASVSDDIVNPMLFPSMAFQPLGSEFFNGKSYPYCHCLLIHNPYGKKLGFLIPCNFEKAKNLLVHVIEQVNHKVDRPWVDFVSKELASFVKSALSFAALGTRTLDKNRLPTEPATAPGAALP